MDNLDEETLVVHLRERGYCLVTNEDGSEQVDEEGKLYVCQDGSDEWDTVDNLPSIRKLYDLPLLENSEESTVLRIGQEVNSEINEETMQVEDEHLPQNYEPGDEWVPVANLPSIRKLYDLPLLENSEESTVLRIGQEVNSEINEETMQVEDDHLRQNYEPGEEIDKSKMVWMGQRSRACHEASRALIEIIDTPKYQEQMNNKGLVKLKVWEKIAADIQARGFIVAINVKEAGLRTFQKWRNMERAYWTYVKNPEERGDNMRKKKPPFFEHMDQVMKKMSKFASKLVDPVSKSSADETTGRGTEITFVKALLKNLLSDKYPEFYKSGGKSVKVWYKICKDLGDQGFEIFGKSSKERSRMMYRKWRTMENKFHKYQLQTTQSKGRPLCYDLLSKVIYKCLILKQTPFIDEKKLEEFNDSDENSQSDITDHVYSLTKKSRNEKLTEDNVNTFSSEEIVSALNTTNEALAMTTDTLLQIKAFNESMFKVQRDHHMQIKSLMEAQLVQQRTLNSLFNDYVVNRPKKVKSGSSKVKN